MFPSIPSKVRVISIQFLIGIIQGVHSRAFFIFIRFSARRNESVATNTSSSSSGYMKILAISGLISDSDALYATALIPSTSFLIGSSTDSPLTTGIVGKSS